MLLNYKDKEQIPDKFHKSNFVVQNVDLEEKITDHVVKNDLKNSFTQLI